MQLIKGGISSNKINLFSMDHPLAYAIPPPGWRQNILQKIF